MYRGTTPTHTFTLPFDAALVEKLRITYAQAGREILVKSDGDLSIEGNVVTVQLTQEETLAFRCNREVEMQIAARTPDGDVIKSTILRTKVARCLNSEKLQ